MAFDGKEFRGPGGVNVAECLRVAELVEKSATFDMRREFHACGTPACILGHTMPEAAEQFGKAYTGVDFYAQAGAKLGLGERSYMRLFQPTLREVANWGAYEGEPAFITNAHAAACLRKLAETGEVDWLGTKPDQHRRQGLEECLSSCSKTGGEA